MTNDGLGHHDLRNPGGHVRLRYQSAVDARPSHRRHRRRRRLSLGWKKVPDGTSAFIPAASGAAVWPVRTEKRLIKRDPPVRRSLSASALGRGNLFQLQAALTGHVAPTGDL